MQLAISVYDVTRLENTTSIYTSDFLFKGLYYKARVIDTLLHFVRFAISDFTRAYVPNFTVKPLLDENGLLSQEVSYRIIYREVKSAGFQFLPARKKGVLTSCNGKKSKAFAKECYKVLSSRPNFFSRDIAFYPDGVFFVHKTNFLVTH